MRSAWSIEVWYKPEVTDPLEESVRKGVADLDIQGLEQVRTGQKYLMEGSLTKEQVERICRELLANPVIQEYKIQPFRGPLTPHEKVSPPTPASPSQRRSQHRTSVKKRKSWR